MSDNFKRLALLGQPAVGKATLAGNMLHKFGGIELDAMEKIQSQGAKTYREVSRTLVAAGMPLQFYVPPSQKTRIVYAAILVVAPGAGPLTDSLDGLGQSIQELFKAKKVIIAVNKMDHHNWEEETFQTTAKSTQEELKKRGFEAEGLHFIPISATLGDNLLEVSKKSPWYTVVGGSNFLQRGGVTLLEAIKVVTENR